MNESMFFMLLLTLWGLTAWLAFKLDGIKRQTAILELLAGPSRLNELRGAIKEAVLEALDEHADPRPIPHGPFEEGFEERLKDWKERHGR